MRRNTASLIYSRPARPRSVWSAPRIATSGLTILVPRAHDPSGPRQGSRALAWPNTESPPFMDFSSNLVHSRPQRPRSFWSAPRIATSGPSGQVQRHSGFQWFCKHNRLRPEPIRFVRLDSEHAQSDGKSVNRGLPLLDLARGRDSWC